jgi:hypothetical protein
VGFYIRKSLRAGPFRFNLSKSGLGVSAGVPGFRVGTGPRGNYVHVGTHGVYYRASLGGGSRAALSPQPTDMPVWAPPAGSEILMEDTTGATATDLVATGADDLVAQLNQAAARWPLWPLAFAAAVAGAIGLGSPGGIVLAVLAAPAVLWLWLHDKAKRSVVAFYEVGGSSATWFDQLVEEFRSLSQAKGLWRINASGRVTSTYQYKVNSGASAVVSRIGILAGLQGPAVLVTNIAVPSLRGGAQSLHFLPDRVLVKERAAFLGDLLQRPAGPCDGPALHRGWSRPPRRPSGRHHLEVRQCWRRTGSPFQQQPAAPGDALRPPRTVERRGPAVDR